MRRVRFANTNAYLFPPRSKKSKVQNQGLAATILQGLMPITTEPEPEDSDEDAPSRVCVDTFLENLYPDSFSSRRCE